MTPTRRRWRACVAVLPAIAACGPEPVTLPEPPKASETAQLAATYDNPTAVLDTSNIEAVAADARARLADLNLAWLPDLAVDTLTRARGRMSDGGLPTDPAVTEDTSRPIIRAAVDVHRVCVGWSDPAGLPDEAANGAIHLTAIVEDGRLDPELWGPVSACRTRVVVGPAAIEATFDGTLIIYLLAPLPQRPADGQFLLSFEGTIGANGQTHQAAFDFEYLQGSIRFRVPVASGGDAIVTVGTTFGVEGANAGFTCDLTARTCQSQR